MNSLKKLPAVFYATRHGNEPVREWLLSLDETDRRAIGFDIATAEFGWPIGMPLCRSLNNGLWEIRSSISSQRIARVIFTVIDERIVLLNGFVKKTKRTPISELNLALKRKNELTT